MRDLDLALIGNGAIGLLIDASGSIVWGCFPRFDSDATFSALLDEGSPGAERGIWSIDLVDLARTEQSYITNTAVLTTRLFDKAGNGVEITDCVPRFAQFGRIFHPAQHRQPHLRDGRMGHFVKQHEQHIAGYEFRERLNIFWRKALELRIAVAQRERSRIDTGLKTSGLGLIRRFGRSG